MAKNFIEFDGGDTPLPEKLRIMKTVGDESISPASKFVYLALRWSKSVLNTKKKRFDPSYLFMKKRFGVSSDTYNKALIELSEAGVIEIGHEYCGEKKYLTVDIISNTDDIAERIPSVIITTEVLTMHQKLFLSLLWGMLFVDGDNYTISTYFSSRKIADDLKKIGISNGATYKRLNELSKDDSGYIKIINTRIDGGLQINMKALLAIWNYEDVLWARFKMLGGKKSDYPIYIKPKPGDFEFNGEKIIKK